MLKSFLLFAAVVLLVTASASAPARPPQDASAPTPRAVPSYPLKHMPRPKSSMSWIVRFATVRPVTARLTWRRICN